MAKSDGYITIDPGCKVTLYDPDDQNLPIKLRVLHEGGFIEVPLNESMLRELGYHCALFFRQRTGRDTFMPQGFKHPEPHAQDTRHKQAPEVVTPQPRVRVRTRPVT